MKYSITVDNLKLAINEGVNRKKTEYQNLKFVDTILKEYKEYVPPVKNILKTKRDGGKILYNYLLNECGCGSKYNKLAEYMDYKNEDELLYDEPINEYDGDPFQDYDLEHDDSERWDQPIEDIYDGDMDSYPELEGGDNSEKDDIEPMPKYWVAEKGEKRLYSECSTLSEDIVKETVAGMEKDGYKVTAFKSEAEMKKYLKT